MAIATVKDHVLVEGDWLKNAELGNAIAQLLELFPFNHGKLVGERMRDVVEAGRLRQP
jgi:hypothetical protein